LCTTLQNGHAVFDGAPVSFGAPQTKRCASARTGAAHVVGAGAAGSRLTECRDGEALGLAPPATACVVVL